MHARTKMLNKIQALRAKTEQASCTEHETIAAAELAAKLMSEWEIEEAELLAHEGKKPADAFDIGSDSTVFAGRNQSKATMVWTTLEALCRCRMVMWSVRGGHKYEISGDRPDREFFFYLFRLIHEAMENEYLIYARRYAGQLGRAAKPSFQLGMAQRIRERIRQLITERDQQQATSGSRNLPVLVADKKQQVQAYFERRHPQLSKSRSNYSVGHGGAFAAGRAAGDRVGLGRPVAGAGQGRLSQG